MTQEKIERINFLAQKKKAEGLTPDELAEQQELYKEYIAGYRRNLQSSLGGITIQNPDGSKTKLKKK